MKEMIHPLEKIIAQFPKEKWLKISITNKTTLRSRENFLKIAQEQRVTTESTSALDAFIRAIGVEGNHKFPGEERDLWIGFHLAILYMEAERWDQALETVYITFDHIDQLQIDKVGREQIEIYKDVFWDLGVIITARIDAVKAAS